MTEAKIANATYLGFLYGMHQEGVSASEAHAKLLEATMIEALTMEQVNEHYERIEGREFNMKVHEKPNTHISKLLGIPTICDALMHHCDLSDRLTLRKVSHTFKDIVERSKLKLTCLVVCSDGAHRAFEANDSEVVYRNNGTTVDVIQKNSERKANLEYEKNDPYEVYRNDAKIILNLPRLEIEKLRLANYCDRGDFQAILSQLNLKLKVGTIFTRDINYIRYLEPGFLSSIHCSDLDNLTIGDVDVISQLDQWKSAKELITKITFRTSNFAELFGQFDYVDLFVGNSGETSMEYLVALKDKLLHHPTLQKFEIIPLNGHNENDLIFLSAPNAFLPFQDPNDDRQFNFKYPDLEERLSVRIAYDGPLFKGPCYCGDKFRYATRRQARVVENDEEVDAVAN